jgi:hypothetical protein
MIPMLRELCCIGSCTIIPIILVLCGLYAYQVNAKRAPDDPLKRDYSPYAPWIAPISFPLIIIFNAVLFIFSSLAFGVFLVLFPFALLLLRRPFLFKWISKQALKIGNFVLKVNTELLRVAGFHPTSIRYTL